MDMDGPLAWYDSAAFDLAAENEWPLPTTSARRPA